MEEKNLIIHIPVLHKGYLDFFKTNNNRISHIYLIAEELLKELSEFKPDIASIETETAKELLNSLGFKNISVISKDNIDEVKKKEIILVQDEISRNLYEKYLQGEKVEWASVFLRWDKSSVLSEKPLNDISSSNDSFDVEMIREAYKEAQKSSDWWRQIGAVLVKDKTVLIKSYNQDLPSDHTPYQVGEVRDFLKVGERPDLANTIHAEQKIISQAAKKGISLEGTALYLTHFPCPICSKLIACSGISHLYFSEGSSVFDGKKALESARVNIFQVKCSSI